MSTDIEFLAWLEAQGFITPRLIADGIWVAIKRFMFTYAIMIGEVGDEVSFLDRWCYKTQAQAQAALQAWDGVGEPSGWHRHPTTGRRVSDDPNTIDDQGRRVPVGEMYHYA